MASVFVLSAESQRLNLPSLKRSNFFSLLCSALGAFNQTSPAADKEQRAGDHTLEPCACKLVTQGSGSLEGSDLQDCVWHSAGHP